MAIEAGTKFLGIASSVDTVERRSKRINDKSEYHTIEEIAEAATAGIVFPDPVDADTIVGQLDAENYTTIESYLSGKLPYELTVLNIPTFNTSTTSGISLIYTNNDTSIITTPPLIEYDSSVNFAYGIKLQTTLSGQDIVTCSVKSPLTGAPLFPLAISTFIDVNAPENETMLYFNIYDVTNSVVDTSTSPALNFGLLVEIKKY